MQRVQIKEKRRRCLEDTGPVRPLPKADDPLWKRGPEIVALVATYLDTVAV